MARGVNIVTLDGHLGRDPEYKTTQGGNGYAVLGLATSTESKKDQAGEWEDIAQWHRVIVWGPDGDYLAQNAHKGDRCFVSGAITYRSWEKDGQKHNITEIKATVAKHWPKDGSKRPARQEQQGPPGGQDDDIPF